MATDRLTEVLDATYDCLARYGVRRTTMDDIASTMGVSRSAVYQYVNSKDDAFRRLAERLHTEALAQAGRAAAADAPYAERVRGVLDAKLRLVLRLTGDSPHTAELMDAKARLFGDICLGFTTELRGLLTELFTDAETHAGPSDGTATLSPSDAADVCLALVRGLESTPDGARLLPPAADALLTGLLGGAPQVRPAGSDGATVPVG
ncbi:TetR/AcrR family transcriptional regulator [Streptomyces sp. SID3212]|uniref:TetR family transcriptional regulator n=1 Tax=Streptomyces sp. SID3212 TaxID=2690259 RepID=UPI00136BF95C|nr:TetR family transcriptional regulator [Streptomyces sp. SID3212]